MPWSQHVTRLDERPVLILIDEGYWSRAPIPELPRLAWFAVYTRHDPGGAFWHPDETGSLNAVENDLIQLCGLFGRGWAVYVLRIASRGIREYFVYCGDKSELASVLPSLRAAHPQYRIEYDEMMDEEWKRYTSCLADKPSRLT